MGSEAIESCDAGFVWILSQGASRKTSLFSYLAFNQVAQVFASKADLLPKAYIESLACVLDACGPMEAHQVEQVLRTELGAPHEAVFAEFDMVPIGSATIAQVHRAMTMDGTRVAVKVQNVNNQRLMRADLANMLAVSKFLDRLNIRLPFDHTSILLEYTAQVCFLDQKRFMILRVTN